MKIETDIDIDFYDRELALVGLPYVAATKDNYLRHASGVYFQDVPIDPISGNCSLPYNEATELGYFKIDFLNNRAVYEDVRDEDHLYELTNKEPPWELFEDREVVSMLVHVAEHFGIVQEIKPKSIIDLAIILALMRPAKRYLLGRPRKEIDKNIWLPEDNGFQFKKSHSLAYAMCVVVQLNLLCEKALEN